MRAIACALRACACRALAFGVALLAATAPRAAELPIFDAHLHYSHDAWEQVPPEVAIDLLRRAGLRRALVSSGCSRSGRRRRSCGRTPVSSRPDACARCCASIATCGAIWR
jgi:hypothetical protein